MFQWLKDKFSKEKKKPELTLQIWSVVRGPMYAEDLPVDEEPEGAVCLLLKVAQDKDVFDAEFWFEEVDDAKKIMQHFEKSILPLEISLEDYELVKK